MFEIVRLVRFNEAQSLFKVVALDGLIKVSHIESVFCGHQQEK
jgi:hypothetical protein